MDPNRRAGYSWPFPQGCDMVSLAEEVRYLEDGKLATLAFIGSKAALAVQHAH